MATTWIKPTYAHKRYNSKTTIKRKIDYIIDRQKTTIGNLAIESEQEQNGIGVTSTINDYVQDPDKTENNALVSSYECSPECAEDEFTISMEQYLKNTGRKQTDNSRLIYHMRQSFKPGEIDPATANRIGYELALEFTKGQHQFIAATHVDKAHIHNHIIFSAFNLNCDGKFKDPWFSAKRDVARISDKLCREYGLSVIEVKQGWRDPYNEWEKKNGISKEDKEPNKRKQLENLIAVCLEKQPKDFKHFLKLLEDDCGCVVKKRGKNISVITPFSKNPFRLNSLSDEFTEAGIKQQIEDAQLKSDLDFEDKQINNTDTFFHADVKPDKEQPKPGLPMPETNLRLIIDIQNSLKATENIGYKKWAEKFNLEQMSQTLLFIEKHELTLDELQNMARQKPLALQNIKDEIGTVDDKLQQISLLQRHIGSYGKTKDIYKQYKQSKNKEQFKQENMKAISDHEAAKVYFDEHGYGFGSGRKLPTIKELREDYAKHSTDKKVLWAKYHETKNADKEIDNAWLNVKTLLNINDDATVMPPEQKTTKRNAPSL